jgi:formylglycine-generating enzyme required for sulfatase activity
MNSTREIASHLAVIAVCLLCIPLFAQTAPQPELYALVVGVTKYDKAELNGLRFPEKDAQAVAFELEDLGYTKVDLLTGSNATKAAITEKLSQFSKRGSNKGIVFVFLSGHGTEMEVDGVGTSFFSPYDTEMKALRDAKNRATSTLAPTKESMVAIDDILLALKESKAAHRILITDCCRDDATRSKQMRTKSFGTSLKTENLPNQTVMLLSCSPGQTSVEHDDWGHGALTKCLLDELRALGQTGRLKTMGGIGEDLLPAVEMLVSDKSRGQEEQSPRLLSIGRVEMVLRKREPEALADLKKKQSEMKENETAGESASASGSNIPMSYVSNSTGMEFVLIPAGTFTMGSPESEIAYSGKHESDEAQHQVTISNPYYLGKYEVTQSEFDSIMGFNPSRFGTDVITPSGGLPVESVTWFDAVMFCNKLSQKDGRTAAYSITDIQLEDGKKNIKSATVRLVSSANGYRLPTEAEWEYACRAGTPTAFNSGATVTADQANIDGKRNSTLAAKSFKPNAFGLHNMHGNVFEWCWDYYADYGTAAVRDPQGPVEGSNRMLRGGSWSSEPVGCRSAFRGRNSPGIQSFFLGFRVSLQSVR